MKLSTILLSFNTSCFPGSRHMRPGTSTRYGADRGRSDGTRNPRKKKKKKQKAEKSVAYLTLADLLRRKPGVLVQGSGASARVSIRGGAGPSGTDPLYVIDRVPIGNNYSQAAGMVDVNDIANIRVLSGADASQYGTRGNSGVIENYY